MPRERRIHFLPQTVEAQKRGIICLRGKHRDPRDCDGYDCATDIYFACIEMLQERQRERYAQLNGTDYKMIPETKFCDYCSKFDKHTCPKRNEVNRSASWANHCKKFRYRRKKRIKKEPSK